MKTTSAVSLKSCCLVVLLVILAVVLGGCDNLQGYSTEQLFSDEISSVCVKMFDNKSFERGVEYTLTDALAKRIEARTPYKVVSSPDRADSVLSGQIERVERSILSAERETGRPLEKEALLTATINWKNLKTGEYLIEGAQLSASATYAELQNQGIRYGSDLAANRLAERIVEEMEKPW